MIDLDGTLVDSVPDLAWCVDEMMKAIGFPARGEDKVRHWVGNGVPRLIERALTDDLNGQPDPALYEQAAPIFFALYAEHTCTRSQLYPHVKEGLDYLQSQGIPLGCVTNKNAQFTLPILTQLSIRDFFAIIISGDTLPQKKPDPAPLLHGANFFGAEPSRCLLIGDSVSDVKAARAAGFHIICMQDGYNHGIDIHTAEPDAVIADFSELKQLI